MRGIRISSRYARSLLNLSKELNEMDVVFSDMKKVHEATSSCRDLRVFLESPVIKSDKKEAVLRQIFGPVISKTTLSFLSLLTHKGRESMLAEIAESFISQVQDHNHITTARVTSATAMDSSIRSEILDLARKMAGGSVELSEKVDADLIGGFVLQVGDQQIDTSLLSNIKNLRRGFSENPFIPAI